MSPGSAEHDVAAAQRGAAARRSIDGRSVRRIASSRFAVRLRARLAQRVRLRLAAPFRHRLGEVREEHREPEPERELEREAPVAPCRCTTSRSEHERRVARCRRAPRTSPGSAPCAADRASRTRRASPAARSADRRGRLRARGGSGSRECIGSHSEQLPGAHQQVLDDRAERERGEEGERADDQDHADEQRRRRAASSPGTSRPTPARSSSRRGSRPSASIGTIIANRPMSVVSPSMRVVVVGRSRQPGERAAVVARRRRERVQDLRQAVRARRC